MNFKNKWLTAKRLICSGRTLGCLTAGTSSPEPCLASTSVLGSFLPMSQDPQRPQFKSEEAYLGFQCLADSVHTQLAPKKGLVKESWSWQGNSEAEKEVKLQGKRYNLPGHSFADQAPLCNSVLKNGLISWWMYHIYDLPTSEQRRVWGEQSMTEL